MHFFNPRAVAEKLRDDVLSERDKFGFVVVLLMWQVLNGLPDLMGRRQQPLTLILAMVFYFIVTLVGLRICFATNMRGDNKQFMERWLCLSVPLSFWTIVFPGCLWFTSYVVSYAFIGRAAYRLFGSLSPLFSGIGMLLFILYFVMLNHFIAIAASGSSPEDEQIFSPLAAP